MDIDDRLLFRNRLLFSFTQLTPRPPELLFLKRHLPHGLFFLVQLVRIHVPLHLCTTLFIQVLEERAHGALTLHGSAISEDGRVLVVQWMLLPEEVLPWVHCEEV